MNEVWLLVQGALTPPSTLRIPVAWEYDDMVAPYDVEMGVTDLPYK